MTLTAGSTIGPHTVDREIGRGGMGVVYLGRDTRLDRAVAIKSLPEHLAMDPERLARFEREAKTLATLSHPNVAGIYGVEESEGAKYLILEYVEGESLADLLDHGPLPVDEALQICAQVAAGVEAAHEAGVIHRDLKPGNIVVSPDGRAKVLDFGLAKEIEGRGSSLDLSHSPTATLPSRRTPHTAHGQVVGTAAYLSPEQARGKLLDKRTDIWSFGCTLYEALTAKPLFGGETSSDSIAAILEREPDYSALPARTPTRVRELLKRCLEKDAQKRLRDIGDARIELDNALARREWTTESIAAAIDGAAQRSPARVALIAAIGAVVGSALTIAIGNATPKGASAPSAPMRFDLPIIVDGEEKPVDDLAIAPDGSAIAIAPIDAGPIYVRELDSFEFRALEGTEGADWPRFSPDGRWIAFFQSDQLLRAPRDGGLAIRIADARGLTQEGEWLDDRYFVDIDGENSAIKRIDVETGAIDELSTLENDQLGLLGFESVLAVPGESYMLAGAYTGNSVDAYSIVKVDLADGSLEVVLANAAYPLVSDADALYFLRDSSLFVAPFDREAGVVTGDVELALDGVTAGDWGGEANAALSRSGALVYLPGERLSIDRRLARVNLAGEVEYITDPDALDRDTLSISPDGDRFALNTLRRALESWIYDANRKSMQRIASEGESYHFRWSNDGERIAYTNITPEGGYSNQSVYIRNLQSGAQPRLIGRFENVGILDWFPDDQALLLSQAPGAQSEASALSRLMKLDRDSPEELTPLFEQGVAYYPQALFSPDGKWLAYLSDESGQRELFIRRFPELDRAWQVSFSGSGLPNWSPDSDRLYWVERDRMMQAVIQEDETGRVSIGAPEELFVTPWPRAWSRWNAWRMGPDGNFYAIAPAEWEQNPASPRVIVNFTSEFENNPR